MKGILACSNIVILLLFFFSTSLRAQPFVSRIYTANHGLPDAYTVGLFQDRQGYMWIGTHSGLSRFDGHRFVTIQQNKQPSALKGNVVLQDHLDRLWVTHNKTICILESDTIICYPTNDGEPMNYVFSAVQLSDNRIWALVDRGAYEFNGSQWSRISFPDPFYGLNCRQVIESPEGLYFNFEKHIAFQTKTGTFEIISPNGKDAFYINIQKSGDAIYANRVNGMIKMQNGKVSELFSEQLSQTTNYNFIIDSRQRFWIATDKYGILASNPGNESYLDHTITLPFNLSTFLLEDKDHHIWATNYEGLIKISEVDYLRFDKETGSEFEFIRCIATNPQGDLYFASSGHVFKMAAGVSKPVPISLKGIEGFSEDVVDGMCFDGDAGLWLITRERKLIYVKDNHAKNLTALLPFSYDGLHDISYDDRLNKIIIASDKLYIGDANGFKSWGTHFSSQEVNQPRFISILRDGRYLVNSMDDGIVMMSNDDEVINLSDQFEITEPSREIGIYEDPQHGIWLTKQGEGITHFLEPTKNHFEKEISFTTRDGLPNNSIVSAVFDKRGKLWLTTLSGIATISASNSHKDNYVIELRGEELGRTVLNWGASRSNITCDANNQTWVSTFHELFRFDGNKNFSSVEPPVISIEEVKLNLKETDWSEYTDSTTGYFNIPHEPVFKHRENSLGITFRGISFSENPALMYSYILASSHADPSGKLWSEPSSSNEVSFVALPPGIYSFAVRAKEGNSGWSNPAVFQFTIQPPFWKTWWFLLSTTIVISFFIWSLMRNRIRQIQHKSDLNKQLYELEMKALKAQMNPHFIYNALNSIQSLVMDGKQQEAVRYMSKFARLLRQVLEHSGANLITLDKELQMLDLYVQLEMLRMNAKLDYSVVLDDQILAEKEYVPPLILQPFIENALWHGLSRKEGEKKLRVEINADDQWLMISITDNGIGRHKAEELKSGNLDYPRSMGMEITSNRLKVVNNQHHHSLEIHDIRDVDGNAAGTQVWVKIKRQNRIAQSV